MSEERERNHVYQKALKLFYLRTNYVPGPMMEEKIIGAIRRRKLRAMIYKISLALLLISVALFLGPSKLREPILELSEKFRPKPPTGVEETTGATPSQQVKDPVFEMLKYLSVANDGDWNSEQEDWGDEDW